MIEKNKKYLRDKGIDIKRVHLYIHNMFRLLYFGNDFRVKDLDTEGWKEIEKQKVL